MGWEKPQITPGNFFVELIVHGGDEVVLVLMEDGTPLLFGLEADEVFGVEEAGVVGAVVGASRLAGAFGGFGEGAQNVAWRDWRSPTLSSGPTL